METFQIIPSRNRQSYDCRILLLVALLSFRKMTCNEAPIANGIRFRLSALSPRGLPCELGVKSGSATQAGPETPRALVNDLVQALNTQDDEKLRTFLTTYTATGGPIEDRVKRFGGFAKQGGPFKIAGDGKETDAEVDAFHVTDRDHSRLDLASHDYHATNLCS